MNDINLDTLEKEVAINFDYDKAKYINQALQEKQEREKGCEYCNNIECCNNCDRVFYKEFMHDTNIITSLDDAHLQIAFDNESGWVMHFEDDYGERMFDVKIDKCPICGRKLGEKHE